MTVHKWIDFINLKKGMGSMFCDKCGQQIDSSDKFCPRCGAVNSEFREKEAPEQKEIQVKKRISMGYLAGISVLAVCIIAGIVFLGIQALRLKDSLDESESRQNKTEAVKVSGKEDTVKKNEINDIENQGNKAVEENKVEIKPNTTGNDGNNLTVNGIESRRTDTNGAENGTTTASTTNQDYILPESNSRFYSETEINALDEHDLFIARNEIYARHGRMFKNEELKNYFASKSWYVPHYTAEEFDTFGDTRFNEYEIFNRNAIVERDNQLKGN